MKTILISGGAGYIGTQLTISLLKKYKVIVYDIFYFPWLLKNKKKIKNHKNLKFIKKNIFNVRKEDFEGVDIVCDLNGISNDPSSEINSKHTWKINYFSRLKFAKFAKKAGVSRYIFNSTCSVYGFNKKMGYENSNKNPISTYSKANFKAERKILLLKNEKFKVNALRNSTLFGFSNAMRLDLVINVFVLNLMNKKKIYIDGDGNQYRPFISIDDICKVYNILIKNNLLPSFICNLVSFNSKINSIAVKICSILNSDKNLIEYKKNFEDKRNYIVGSKNFKKYFGKSFKFSKFEKVIINLKNNLKKFKINANANTIRMKFYKKKLS
mgnify:CR=1 FL=1